jgi:hypothetical protein
MRRCGATISAAVWRRCGSRHQAEPSGVERFGTAALSRLEALFTLVEYLPKVGQEHARSSDPPFSHKPVIWTLRVKTSRECLRHPLRRASAVEWRRRAHRPVSREGDQAAAEAFALEWVAITPDGCTAHSCISGIHKAPTGLDVLRQRSNGEVVVRQSRRLLWNEKARAIMSLIVRVFLVAGVGFEPTTFRL